jgi:hypothetical protein
MVHFWAKMIPNDPPYLERSTVTYQQIILLFEDTCVQKEIKVLQ